MSGMSESAAAVMAISCVTSSRNGYIVLNIKPGLTSACGAAFSRRCPSGMPSSCGTGGQGAVSGVVL